MINRGGGLAGEIAKRLLQGLVVLLVISLLSFVLVRALGDPVHQMTGLETGLEEREAMRESLGLNDPLAVQYLRYLGRILQGDAGFSWQAGGAVQELLLQRFPASFELALTALLFALATGIPAGILTGLRPRSLPSRLLSLISLGAISLPTFLVGILLILLFSVVWQGLLPGFGRGEVVVLGWWSTGFLSESGLLSLILPSLTLGLFLVGLVQRLVKSEIEKARDADHVLFARARGMPPGHILLYYLLPPCLLPVLTMTGLQFGQILAFSVITEAVFQWPGTGLLFLNAIRTADMPVITGYLLMVACLIMAINLVTDCLCFLADPRAGQSGQGGV